MRDVNEALQALCLDSGFEAKLTSHSYRRLVAQVGLEKGVFPVHSILSLSRAESYLGTPGASINQVQHELGHQWMSSVTRLYMSNMSCVSLTTALGCSR